MFFLLAREANSIKRTCISASGWFVRMQNKSLLYCTLNTLRIFAAECNYDCKFLDTSHYPPFYRTVLSEWQEVNAAIQKENQSIHNEFIWNNKHIVVNNKSLYIKPWYEAGVTKIKNLVENEILKILN